MNIDGGTCLDEGLSITEKTILVTIVITYLNSYKPSRRFESFGYKKFTDYVL